MKPKTPAGTPQAYGQYSDHNASFRPQGAAPASGPAAEDASLALAAAEARPQVPGGAATPAQAAAATGAGENTPPPYRSDTDAPGATATSLARAAGIELGGKARAGDTAVPDAAFAAHPAEAPLAPAGTSRQSPPHPVDSLTPLAGPTLPEPLADL